eukprot:364003-Chlamydomonas_euryale.AAC.2
MRENRWTGNMRMNSNMAQDNATLGPCNIRKTAPVKQLVHFVHIGSIASLVTTRCCQSCPSKSKAAQPAGTPRLCPPCGRNDGLHHGKQLGHEAQHSMLGLHYRNSDAKYHAVVI